jgi:hypothetical protein
LFCSLPGNSTLPSREANLSVVSNDPQGLLQEPATPKGRRLLDPSSIWKEKSDCKDYSYSFIRQVVEKKIPRSKN